MTGLYIHVPFCVKKCHYCNFVIAAASPPEGRSAFFGALEAEAERYSPHVQDIEFDTVYLGGGTPSVLNVHEFERLFRILRSRFKWKPDAEITAEANPGDVDAEKARVWRKMGVNRVSLGAQTFHDDTLKKLNRAHDSSDIDKSFKNLRQAGFMNISLDLILSLPGESWEKAKVSLERLAMLGPEHVSLYELSIEEKTVFGEMSKKGELALPLEPEQFQILSEARRFLQDQGYRHYELLNYAMRGRESKHNLLYWANEDTIGLGPGAYSYFQGRRYRNSETVQQYLAKAAAKDWTPVEEETLTGEKKEIESFLLALRLAEGAPSARFGTVLKRFEKEVLDLTEKGLLTQEKGKVRLTERGRFLAETVFTELSC